MSISLIEHYSIMHYFVLKVTHCVTFYYFVYVGVGVKNGRVADEGSLFPKKLSSGEPDLQHC